MDDVNNSPAVLRRRANARQATAGLWLTHADGQANCNTNHTLMRQPTPRACGRHSANCFATPAADATASSSGLPKQNVTLQSNVAPSDTDNFGCWWCQHQYHGVNIVSTWCQRGVAVSTRRQGGDCFTRLLTSTANCFAGQLRLRLTRPMRQPTAAGLHVTLQTMSRQFNTLPTALRGRTF